MAARSRNDKQNKPHCHNSNRFGFQVVQDGWICDARDGSALHWVCEGKKCVKHAGLWSNGRLALAAGSKHALCSWQVSNDFRLIEFASVPSPPQNEHDLLGTICLEMSIFSCAEHTKRAAGDLMLKIQLPRKVLKTQGFFFFFAVHWKYLCLRAKHEYETIDDHFKFYFLIFTFRDIKQLRMCHLMLEPTHSLTQVMKTFQNTWLTLYKYKPQEEIKPYWCWKMENLGYLYIFWTRNKWLVC